MKANPFNQNTSQGSTRSMGASFQQKSSQRFQLPHFNSGGLKPTSFPINPATIGGSTRSDASSTAGGTSDQAVRLSQRLMKSVVISDDLGAAAQESSPKVKLYSSPTSAMKNSDVDATSSLALRDTTHRFNEASTFMGSSSTKYLNDSVSSTTMSSSIFKRPNLQFLRAEDSTIVEPSMFSLRAEDISQTDAQSTHFQSKASGTKQNVQKEQVQKNGLANVALNNLTSAHQTETGIKSWIPAKWQVAVPQAQEPQQKAPKMLFQKSNASLRGALNDTFAKAQINDQSSEKQQNGPRRIIHAKRRQRLNDVTNLPPSGQAESQAAQDQKIPSRGQRLVYPQMQRVPVKQIDTSFLEAQKKRNHLQPSNGLQKTVASSEAAQVEETKSSSDEDEINSVSFRLKKPRTLYAKRRSKKVLKPANAGPEKNIWRGTFTVLKKTKNLTSGQQQYTQEAHPIFIDTQVGFEPKHATCLQEHRQDDDVDTDEEIYDNALKACSRDFNEVRARLDRQPANQLVNNFEITKRVQNPDCYDRNGKFFDQSRPQLHPSMSMLQIARSAQSEQQSKFQ